MKTDGFSNDVVVFIFSRFCESRYTERTHIYIGRIAPASFYKQALSKTRVGDVYLVEKILQRKGVRVLVDGRHNSWIPKKELM